MSYYINITDYRGLVIQLSDASWEHIRECHPEITLAEIQKTLEAPGCVLECPRQQFVELFYRERLHIVGKQRFCFVAVKSLPAGRFVSTAMTATALKNGRTLYQRKN